MLAYQTGEAFMTMRAQVADGEADRMVETARAIASGGNSWITLSWYTQTTYLAFERLMRRFTRS